MRKRRRGGFCSRLGLRGSIGLRFYLGGGGGGLLDWLRVDPSDRTCSG